MTANRKQKNETLGKKMGLGWLVAAVIFLFNPCINIIDILPDFFGVVFLINGLKKWGDLCPGISDALEGLEKLKWFMLLKAAAMILVPFNDDTMVLVLTFGFAVIEMIYFYPAIGRIFDGLEYFGTRFGGRAIYKNLKNVSAITYIFCVGKAVLTVLPELCSLSDYEYDGYVTSGVQINFANYKSALLMVGLFLVSIVGIMWLINVIPYIKRISNDTEFLTKAVNQYDAEILNNKGLTIRRSLKSILFLFTFGIFFIVNIWIDEFNVLPNFIGAIFMIVGFCKLKKYSTTANIGVKVSIAYLCVSVLSYAISTVFAIKYPLSDVMYRFEAYDLYNYTRIASTVEYLLQAGTIFFMIRELRGIIILWLSPDKNISDGRLVNIYESSKKELDKKFIVSLIWFGLSFVLNIVLVLFRADINSALPEFWWIPLIVTLIWIFCQKSASDALYDQVEYKYM